MEEFKVIETQEQLDAIIGERLKREKETQEKRFSGYISPEDLTKNNAEYEKKVGELNKALEDANKKLAEHDKLMAEKDVKIKGYESHSEKTRIAREMGLPYEAVDFLTGEDEAGIRKSAETLKGIVGRQSAPPLASTESAGSSSDSDAVYRTMLQSMEGE